ncbi:unnamed protein product [Rhodiola kirilowii]
MFMPPFAFKFIASFVYLVLRSELSARAGTLQLKYSRDATTDPTGTYKIPVTEDHENRICEVVLISSPQSNCALIAPGADRARAILTTNNGIPSNTRNVNSLAFVRESAQSGCAQVLKAYNESD